MGSIPAERVSTEMDNGEARLARDMGWSHQQQSHLCSIPAERASTALDEEEARLQREIGVLLQQRAEERFWAERRQQQIVAKLRRSTSRYGSLTHTPLL